MPRRNASGCPLSATSANLRRRAERRPPPYRAERGSERTRSPSEPFASRIRASIHARLIPGTRASRNSNPNGIFRCSHSDVRPLPAATSCSHVTKNDSPAAGSRRRQSARERAYGRRTPRPATSHTSAGPHPDPRRPLGRAGVSGPGPEDTVRARQARVRAGPSSQPPAFGSSNWCDREHGTGLTQPGSTMQHLQQRVIIEDD